MKKKEPARMHANSELCALARPEDEYAFLAHDNTADDWECLLSGLDEINVEGSGWAYDPETGEPTISPGLYTVSEFVRLYREWEIKSPGVQR